MKLGEILSSKNRNKLFSLINLTIALLLAITFFIQVTIDYFAGKTTFQKLMFKLFLYYSIPGLLQVVVSYLTYKNKKFSEKYSALIFLPPILAFLISLVPGINAPYITETYFIILNMLYISFYGWKSWLLPLYVLTTFLIGLINHNSSFSKYIVFYLFSFLFILSITSIVGIAINFTLKLIELDKESKKIPSLNSHEELVEHLINSLRKFGLKPLSIECKCRKEKTEVFKLGEGEKEFFLESEGLKVKLGAKVSKLEELLFLPIAKRILLSYLHSYRRFVEEEIKKKELLEFLAKTVELKDPYTKGHSEAVAHYSLLIGTELGLSKEELDLLYKAAILHDIGKIAIPDRILLKPLSLTSQEMEVIKLHPQIGAELVKTIHGFREISELILYHHERMDGSGYPKGIKGEEIPLLSRIIAVADVFDALTSKRPYRKELSIEEAFEIMKKQPLDQNLVEIAYKVLPKKIYKREDVLKIKESKFLDEFRKRSILTCFSCGEETEKISAFLITTPNLESTIEKIRTCEGNQLFYLGLLKDNQLILICSSSLLEVLKEKLSSIEGKVEQLL